METKSLKIEIKADGDSGKISGYGAVFNNIDRAGDRILPGAFSKSIAMARPKMLWQHDVSQPIGVWEDFREDDKGLYMEGKLVTSSTLGRDAYELAKAGAIDGLSIGYRVLDDRDNGGVRELIEIDLMEVSMVTVPANERATITGVKNLEASMTERDFERLLLSNGFSRKAAKIVVADGFKKWRDLREDGEAVNDDDQRDADELLKQSLINLHKTLKG